MPIPPPVRTGDKHEPQTRLSAPALKNRSTGSAPRDTKRQWTRNGDIFNTHRAPDEIFVFLSQLVVFVCREMETAGVSRGAALLGSGSGSFAIFAAIHRASSVQQPNRRQLSAASASHSG
jgi:hypothetical protein